MSKGRTAASRLISSYLFSVEVGVPSEGPS